MVGNLFKVRLESCAHHWANSLRCALEHLEDDMLVVS